MPKFSQGSFSKLSTCHLELQALFYEVIKYYDCTVIEGYRDQEKQEEAFRNKKTYFHFPDGKHNKTPSIAVDVAPYPVDFSEKFKNLARFYLFAGYVLATAEQLKSQGKMTRSIRWGGDWNGDKDMSDQTFNDLVHFELV